jgi:hypothetical protein
MRHCSGVVIGIFGSRTNPEQVFHKEVSIADHYWGPEDGRLPEGPWGMIQGLQVPPPEYIAAMGRVPIGTIGAKTADRQIYMLCMAQDLPNPENRVVLDSSKADVYGAPIPRLFHRYSRRDRGARKALYNVAASVLRRAGALVRVRKPIDTFSHALGTCRFGSNPETAALDPWCRFFGVRNLFVVDSSFMPTSGGVNPSLTIAANALRVGRHIVEEWDTIATGGRELSRAAGTR